MARARYTMEQIIGLLREAEVPPRAKSSHRHHLPRHRDLRAETITGGGVSTAA